METQPLKNLSGKSVSAHEDALKDSIAWSEGYREGYKDAKQQNQERINKLNDLLEAIRLIAFGG